MDCSKLFEDLTWADLIIIGDYLKAVQEFVRKTLKYQEIQTVCS